MYDINVLMEIVGHCAIARNDWVPAPRDVRFVSIASVGESESSFTETGASTAVRYFGMTVVERHTQRSMPQRYTRHMYGITGLPVHPNSALFKILWLRDNGAGHRRCRLASPGGLVAWYLWEQGQDQT